MDDTVVPTVDLQQAFSQMTAVWGKASADCLRCGACASRCELFAARRPSLAAVALAGMRLLAQLTHNGLPSQEVLHAEALQLFGREPQLYDFIRRCSLCNHCTAFCDANVRTNAVVLQWRHLMACADVLHEADSKSVLVDNEWHIFSVYRAVYGIHYLEYPALATVEPGQVDTLFFPGCSLVSYAPDLIRKVGEWLTAHGVSWALSDDCCGSPLNSAGLTERSTALRQRILEQCQQAGITRVVTVCSGCGEELAAVFGTALDIIPLPQLFAEAGERMGQDGSGATGAGAGCACSDILAAPKDGLLRSARGFAQALPVLAENEPLARSPGARTSHSHPAPAPVAPLPLAFFDSCHDRAGTHAAALRTVFSPVPTMRLRHQGRNTRCCGAGGAVGAYDPALCTWRVQRIFDECRQAGARTVVTSCPTCAYTLAFAQRGTGADADAQPGATSDAQPGTTSDAQPGVAPDAHHSTASLAQPAPVTSCHYLELFFDTPIDWGTVFAQLEGMWSGEYAPWVCQQLL